MFDVLGRITELREERGWTQYRLSKNSGVPQSSLSSWYSKKISPPLESLEKMCDALDVSLSEFFDDSKENEDSKLMMVRKGTGISKEELAEKSGVPLKEISAYEQQTRDIKKASFYKVQLIAKALGCSMEDIS